MPSVARFGRLAYSMHGKVTTRVLLGCRTGSLPWRTWTFGPAGWGMGCTVGDVDNDGDPDVYATYLGPNRLYLNDAGQRLPEVAGGFGVADPGWGASAAFGGSGRRRSSGSLHHQLRRVQPVRPRSPRGGLPVQRPARFLRTGQLRPPTGQGVSQRRGMESASPTSTMMETRTSTFRLAGNCQVTIITTRCSRIQGSTTTGSRSNLRVGNRTVLRSVHVFTSGSSKTAASDRFTDTSTVAAASGAIRCVRTLVWEKLNGSSRSKCTGPRLI